MRALHLGLLALVLSAAFVDLSYAQALAPGFTALPKGAKVAFMPSDIELFSISAGGVPEPRADWTEAAGRYFRAALQKKTMASIAAVDVSDEQLDELSEINAVHAAIARAIALHHFGTLHLPTKAGNLDWSMGEAAQLVRKATGADYALFTWVRDGYASAERKAAMAAIAILSLGHAVIGGGQQIAYASLVDLNSGRVVWFNRLQRPTGDLREPDAAAETVSMLLIDFPAAQ
jgi:hypothetical protein